MIKKNKQIGRSEILGFGDADVRGAAVCPSMSRDEEVLAARNIASLEQNLWETILGEPGKARFALERIARSEAFDELVKEWPDLLGMFKRVAALRSKAAAGKSRAYRSSVAALAARLRDVDSDRVLVNQAAREALARSVMNKGNGRSSLSRYGKDVQAAAAKVEEAKHHFIRANQGLVTLIAKRYKHSWIPLGDLMQEGNLGLIKAVNRFDYTRGFQFCTYASWWIRASISRAIDNKESMIRIPGSQLRTRSKLKKAVRLFRQKAGRNPTDGEIASETGLGSLRLERARRNSVTHVYSLDQAISDSNNLRYIDVLVDDTALNPLEKISTAAMADEVSALLKDLSPLERDIICQRFGFDDFEDVTLREIGEQYGLSRERIRQIQNRALEKIRSRMTLDAA